MSRSLSRALACALVVFAAASAWAAPPPRFIDRLHADVDSGKITAEDAIVYETLALDQADLLPQDYVGGAGAASAHCGSEIIYDLARNVPKVHPEVRNFVKYLLSTPHKRLKMKTPLIKVGAGDGQRSRQPRDQQCGGHGGRDISSCHGTLQNRLHRNTRFLCEIGGRGAGDLMVIGD